MWCQGFKKSAKYSFRVHIIIPPPEDVGKRRSVKLNQKPGSMRMAGFLVGFSFDSVGMEAVFAGVERRGDLIPTLDFPDADRIIYIC